MLLLLSRGCESATLLLNSLREPRDLFRNFVFPHLLLSQLALNALSLMHREAEPTACTLINLVCLKRFLIRSICRLLRSASTDRSAASDTPASFFRRGE